MAGVEHPRRYCPVCLETVRPTRTRNIAGHRNSLGKPCGATGQPFEIALDALPPQPPTDRRTTS